MNDDERAYLRFRQASPVARRYMFRGEWMTISQIAEATGLSTGAIRYRLLTGIPIEEPRMRGGPKPRSYVFRGELKTAKAVSDLLGIGIQAVRDRAVGDRIADDDEMKAQRAIACNSTLLTFASITDTVSGWSRRTGLHASTIFIRHFYSGWSIADTLTRPPGNSSPHTIIRKCNASIVRRISNRFRIWKIVRGMKASTGTMTGGCRETFSSPKITGDPRHEIHSEGASACR